MDAKKITARDIPNLPTGTHRIEECFYIKVREKTSSYFFRYQRDGKREDITIGSAKKISFPIAKSMAAEYKAKLSRGENISLEKKSEKKKAEIKSRIPLFKDIALECIDATEKVREWTNPKSKSQWTNTLKTYAFPKIGNIPINEIKKEDVLFVVEPIWYTKTNTASKLLGRINRIIDYATFKGFYEKANPARYKGFLDMVLPSPEKVKKKKHHGAPTIDEALSLIEKFRHSNAVSHKAILFGLLSGGRVSEFVKAKWSEIDFEKRIFYVPQERRKDKKPESFRVPLTDQLIDLLGSIKREDGVEWVFPSRYGGGANHLSVETPREIIQKNLGRKGVTMHGCRTTFRTWCAENRKDRFLAERCLMHNDENKVEQAYQRSDLLEQRRVLMQEWADFLHRGEDDWGFKP